MKKRSAMLMAAGLVIALAVAGAAFSLGATGPASASIPAVARREDKPLVRTVTRIVTVHRNGDPVMAAGSGSAASAPSTVGSDDPSQDASGDDTHEDSFQDDHGEDDGDESHSDHGDDHEDDGGFEVDD